MEVEILLIYQVEYDLSNKAKDINSKVFNMITRINESKTLKKNIFHVIVNVNLMIESVI